MDLPHLSRAGKIVTIIVNVCMWNHHASPLGLAFLLCCIAAAFIYQQAPMRSSSSLAPPSCQQPPAAWGPLLLTALLLSGGAATATWLLTAAAAASENHSADYHLDRRFAFDSVVPCQNASRATGRMQARGVFDPGYAIPDVSIVVQYWYHPTKIEEVVSALANHSGDGRVGVLVNIDCGRSCVWWSHIRPERWGRKVGGRRGGVSGERIEAPLPACTHASNPRSNAGCATQRLGLACARTPAATRHQLKVKSKELRKAGLAIVDDVFEHKGILPEV